MSERESAQARLERMTAFDREYAEESHVLCGMDEAGRGPLAGPVVAAAVILPRTVRILGVNDSKRLSEKRREALFLKIKESAAAIGIGVVDQNEIDAINILNAARKAFEQAYQNLRAKPDTVLCDAITGLNIPGAIPIVKGDAKSYAVAAASIVAKATRDAMMRKADKEYPEYGFEQNKGYGTRDHRDAILRFGPCPLHRKSFLTRIWHEER